jgi:TRAP-type C4-dicarboxylate transport system permease small subunit
MALLARLDRLLRQVSYFGFLAASALLLVVGLMGAADVISTNLFFQPIPGMVELSGALLAVIVFLGLAEAQARGSNIVIDVATQNMGPRMKRFSSIVSLTLAGAVMTLIAWQTTRLAINAWAIREAALGALDFPVAPFKSVAAFGAWLAAAEFARQILREIAAAGGRTGTDGGDHA